MNLLRTLVISAFGLVVVLAPAAAQAAATSGTARATTVRPLSVVRTADLEFGSIIPSATAGTVTINPNTDARTTAGGVIGVGGATPGAAHFTAAGVVSLIAFVTLPGNITLTRVGGGATMTVSNITSNGGAFRTFPGTATIDVTVAGRLNVAANQLAGDYAGTFNLDVTYF